MKSKIRVHDVKPIKNDWRLFLKLSGAALVSSGLIFMVGCSDENYEPGSNPDQIFDLGTGDLRVLNYAYAV